MRSLDDTTRLAQAALRGFFDDPEGFARMDSVRQRKAVEAVQKILGVTPAPGKPEQAPVMQERVQAEVDTRRFRNVTSDGEKIPVTEGEVDVRRFRNVERGEGV